VVSGGWEGGHGWTLEEEDALKEAFREVGVQFRCLPYEQWPEGKIDGWRMMRSFWGKGESNEGAVC
jgi:hypothetical protein